MDLIDLYFEMLKDPSVPANRVVRKAFALTVIGIIVLALYRHATLGFDFGQPLIATLLLSLLMIVVVGMFGGIIAGGFYETFLAKVGAQNGQVSLPVFFAEWLFAATAPVLGFVVVGMVGQDTW